MCVRARSFELAWVGGKAFDRIAVGCSSIVKHLTQMQWVVCLSHNTRSYVYQRTLDLNAVCCISTIEHLTEVHSVVYLS